MQLHYQIAALYKPDVHLIGSNTIRAGIELYGAGIPAEQPADFKKPKRKKSLPFWVVIDTKGTLNGLLHTCRQFEFCKDVVVLVSEKTASSYLQYLTTRDYTYHVVGHDHVDLKKAFRLLAKKYDAGTILTDTGRILGNLLLNQGFVDEISLLVHPLIIGSRSYSMFSDLKSGHALRLIRCECLEKYFVWLVYKVIRQSEK